LIHLPHVYRSDLPIVDVAISPIKITDEGRLLIVVAGLDSEHQGLAQEGVYHFVNGVGLTFS
jgi:hypothetical protein